MVGGGSDEDVAVELSGSGKKKKGKGAGDLDKLNALPGQTEKIDGSPKPVYPGGDLDGAGQFEVFDDIDNDGSGRVKKRKDRGDMDKFRGAPGNQNDDGDMNIAGQPVKKNKHDGVLVPEINTKDKKGHALHGGTGGHLTLDRDAMDDSEGKKKKVKG